jgi:hypothetical protein
MKNITLSILLLFTVTFKGKMVLLTAIFIFTLLILNFPHKNSSLSILIKSPATFPIPNSFPS